MNIDKLKAILAAIIKGINYNIDAAATFGANVLRAAGLRMGVLMKSTYLFEAYDPDGNFKWRHLTTNIVVNTGLDDILQEYFKGSTYTAAHFVGLTDGTPTVAAGDTMSSHVGWTEVTAYSEATREALVLGSVASQSVDNAASKASFSINADTTTVGGAFVTTNSTKGGSTGILYGAAAFTAADKSLDNGDTLNVTVTLTAS